MNRRTWRLPPLAAPFAHFRSNGALVQARMARLVGPRVRTSGKKAAHMEISNHSAVVTGGASGLGEATARALAERGAKVAVFDRDRDRGERVAAELGGVFCEVDVTSD